MEVILLLLYPFDNIIQALYIDRWGIAFESHLHKNVTARWAVHSLSAFLVIALISASPIRSTVLTEKKMATDVQDGSGTLRTVLGDSDLGSCWMVNRVRARRGTEMLSTGAQHLSSKRKTCSVRLVTCHSAYKQFWQVTLESKSLIVYFRTHP